MDFVTIDFETATSERGSACEIGLTFVENNQIKDVKSWLIKPFQYPDFSYFNISIHGIYPEDVANEPELPELWETLAPMLEGKFLIAHNAGFDLSVLRQSLDKYNIDYPTLDFGCTYQYSKYVWQNQPNYGLAHLCQINEIPLDHHRAGPDSEATANLALKIFELSEVSHKDDIKEKLRVSMGRLLPGQYHGSRIKKYRSKNDLEALNVSEEFHQPENLFYQKKVVFTGKMSSMDRIDAQTHIAQVGGINQRDVTMETNYLVIGQQDYRQVGDSGMSRKQRTAIKYAEMGTGIEAISEEEFLMNIEY